MNGDRHSEINQWSIRDFLDISGLNQVNESIEEGWRNLKESNSDKLLQKSVITELIFDILCKILSDFNVLLFENLRVFGVDPNAVSCRLRQELHDDAAKLWGTDNVTFFWSGTQAMSNIHWVLQSIRNSRRDAW